MLIPIKLVLVSTTCFFVACWCLLTGNNQVLRGTEFSIELSEKNTVDDLASLSSANECTGALNTNIEDEHVNQDTDSAVPENVGSNKLDDASTSNSIDGAVDGKEGELLDVDVSMQNQFSFKGQVEQEEQIDSGDTLDYPENCRYLYGKAAGQKDPILCDMVASADYTQGLWINNCAEKSILSHGSLHKYTYTQSAIEEFGSAGGTAKSKSCDEKLDRVNTVQFYWQPNTCALQPFEEKQMRQILKDHRILMVGDSLMGQMWESMQLLSGMDVPYHKSYMLVNHKTLFPMDHSDVMECRRLREWVISDGADSDEISATRYAWMNATEGQLWEDICPTFTSKQYHRETSTLDWTYKLADTDVLVLATGHHFQKEDRTLSKAFPQMIKNLIKYLRRIKYTGKIIVSTAPPGHENCDEYRVPISKTPAPVPTEYHWEGITAVEFLWNETFHKSSLRDNFYILNVTFSDLRPDAHFSQGDCLHYCSAGVPDSWVHALYNLLLQVLY